MSLLRVLLVAGIAGGVYHQATKPRAPAANPAAAMPATSNVVVVAAENCPKEDAQRADHLAAELTRQGIPVMRTLSVSFTITEPDSGLPGRLNAIMNGPLPAVFIDDRAKSNPSLAEVVAEFKSRR